MKLRNIIPFAFFLLVELYAYQAYTVVFGNNNLISVLYLSGVFLAFASIYLVFNTPVRESMHIPLRWPMGGFFLLVIPQFFITIFLLGEDIIRLLKVLLNGLGTITGFSFLHFATGRSLWWDSAALIITGLITLVLIYGILFNVYNYKVRRVTLKLLRLPRSFDGLKVVQISDIHSGSLSDKKQVAKAVEAINSLDPDLVFFTGDLVNNIATEAEEYVDIFRHVRARHGVFSILGNHDYGDYMHWENEEAKHQNLEHLKSLHRAMGWRLLLDEHVQIEKDGEKIIVAGVENWSAKGRFHRYGRLEKAMEGIQDAFTVLLLSHDPSHWEAEILDHPARIDVTFSGHTHGMQFGFEFLRFKWSPIKYFYKHWAGLYEKPGQYLYVNRGFGVIGYPGRVGILPEITLLTLQSGSPAE